MSKRYFSIQDVANITGIKPSKLRYLEKNSQDLAVNKIRNRRYYSIEDIEKILSSETPNFSIEEFKQKAAALSSGKRSGRESNHIPRANAILKDIDILLSKFQLMLRSLV